MATITFKELAARYKEAARRQALVERFKAAASLFQPGDRVRVNMRHRFEDWRGVEGVVEKYVPFGKYYVELERYGRQILDESTLDRADQKADPNLLSKDAVFEYLRESSRFSWLVQGMTVEAKKSGESLGMRDAAKILKAWFDGRKPEGPKEEAGYRYIQSAAGQLLMNGLIKGVKNALKNVGGQVGLKDVADAIVSFAEDR